MQFTHRNKTFQGRLSKDQFQSGGLAVCLYSYEPFDESEPQEGYWELYTKLSIWIEQLTPALPPNEFVVKGYSENEGLIDQFIQNGYFELTGKNVNVGHAGICEILRVTDKFSEEVEATRQAEISEHVE